MKSFTAHASKSLLVLVLLAGCGSGLKNTGPANAAKLATASPLWASNPSIGAPRIIESEFVTTDNALILRWEESSPTPDGYYVFLDNPGAYKTYYDVSTPFGWFTTKQVFVPTVSSSGTATTGRGTVKVVPLIPGSTHSLTVWAYSGNFVSGDDPNSNSSITRQLSSPSIRIGDPATNAVSQPVAQQAFAIWDENNNGIVDGEPATGTVFPRGPGSSRGTTAVERGNAFDSQQGGPRANVVVGYFFDEQGVPRFAAFHMLIDSSNNITPISVLYGDAQVGVGLRVWVSPPRAVIQQNITVTEGVPLRTPNIVEGLVTAGTLASDGSQRIVEFSFRLALEPR